MKSVLGEFRSGVSTCRNKGSQSDLGASFLLAPPRPGDTGGPSSGSVPTGLTAGMKKLFKLLLMWNTQ